MREKKSLGYRIALTTIILLAIQFLSQIPLYGINRELISLWVNNELNTSLGIFNMFSGNSFESLSIFALGIAPYISSSIVLQLLRVAIPTLDKKCKEAKSEQEYVENLTYIGAIFLAIIQTLPIVINLANSGLLIENTMGYKVLIGTSVFIGSIILVILGKVIDKKGIGKGISLILLFNILTSFKGDIMNVFYNFIYQKEMATAALAVVISLVVILFSLYVVIQLYEGKKNVKVTYAGRVQNNRTLKSADNIIPLKVNMSGVMPVIFASTIVQLFPMIVSLCKVSADSMIYEISKYFSQLNWFNFADIKYTLGILIYFAAIIFFSYFYNMISFNTTDLANNLSKNGGVVAGIRPGKSTKEYFDKQVKYMVLIGALLLIVVTIIPILIGGLIGMNLSFGGTSIIIIASVLIETYNTIKAEKNMSGSVGTKSAKGLL